MHVLSGINMSWMYRERLSTVLRRSLVIYFHYYIYHRVRYLFARAVLLGHVTGQDNNHTIKRKNASSPHCLIV